jgi:3-methyladenine DNA glycosylase AlkD
MNSAEMVAQLRARANPAALEGMARFGINPASALGISMPDLRALARRTGRDHRLAQDLWETGLHEARILASLVDDPREVDEEQLERWVKDFDSWDVCDQVCSNLFDRTPFAYQKAVE